MQRIRSPKFAFLLSRPRILAHGVFIPDVSRDKRELQKLQRAEAVLGYTFQRPELLKESLTHASIADTRLHSNERMEFLGDAVLDLIVCEALYLKFPELLEGDLTKIKSAVVSRRTLRGSQRRKPG